LIQRPDSQDPTIAVAKMLLNRNGKAFCLIHFGSIEVLPPFFVAGSNFD
jgi:hypothetical protein